MKKYYEFLQGHDYLPSQLFQTSSSSLLSSYPYPTFLCNRGIHFDSSNLQYPAPFFVFLIKKYFSWWVLCPRQPATQITFYAQSGALIQNLPSQMIFSVFQWYSCFYPIYFCNHILCSLRIFIALYFVGIQLASSFTSQIVCSFCWGYL